METDQLQYVLQELRFLSEMSPNVVAQLATDAELRTILAGTIVFREGNENRNLYFLRHGKVALDMKIPGRGAVRILTLGPGEMLGWSALLGEGKMTASALALEDSELIVVSSDKLKELCDEDPHLGYPLMRQVAGALARRLVATRLQLLDLFADSPETIVSLSLDDEP